MTDRRLSSARRRALFVVGALAAIVVLGFLTDRLHGEIDLTAGHSLSLSKETKDVLGHVHREVKITAFLVRADSSRVQAASLLARYRRRNHYVAYRVVDPTEAPGEAARLDIDPAEGGVALSMSGRVERAPTVTESDLTAGIARLLRHHPATLCMATGHGEPSPADTAGGGLSTAAIAWWRWGSKRSPATGAIGAMRAFSSAAVSWRSVSWTPSRSACELASGLASAASRLSITGSSDSAKRSSAYFWALAASAWKRLRAFSASASARSMTSRLLSALAWASASCCSRGLSVSCG